MIWKSLGSFFDKIGFWGRLALAFFPMCIVGGIGIEVGGDESLPLIARVPIILISLALFSLLIFFVQDDDEQPPPPQ